MDIHIKNMVSNRCILIVKSELERMGLNLSSVKLGTAEITEELSETKQNQLNQKLKKWGFVLIDDKRVF